MYSSIASSSDAHLRLASTATRAEQFSLWALRLWWCAFPDLQVGWRDFVHGFQACGVQSAVESCHRLCVVMLSAAGCGSGLACINFPRILPTEEQLLVALSVGAAGEPWVVEMLLRTFAPATAARSAAPLVVNYSQILANAGLSWPGTSASRAIQRTHEDVWLDSGRLH